MHTRLNEENWRAKGARTRSTTRAKKRARADQRAMQARRHFRPLTRKLHLNPAQAEAPATTTKTPRQKRSLVAGDDQVVTITQAHAQRRGLLAYIAAAPAMMMTMIWVA